MYCQKTLISYATINEKLRKKVRIKPQCKKKMMRERKGGG